MLFLIILASIYGIGVIGTFLFSIAQTKRLRFGALVASFCWPIIIIDIINYRK